MADKVAMKNMADESHKVKMEIKWTGPYTIVEVTADGDYKLKDKHGHILNQMYPQDRSSITTTECLQQMMMMTPYPVHIPV